MHGEEELKGPYVPFCRSVAHQMVIETIGLMGYIVNRGAKNLSHQMVIETIALMGYSVNRGAKKSVESEVSSELTLAIQNSFVWLLGIGIFLC